MNYSNFFFKKKRSRPHTKKKTENTKIQLKNKNARKTQHRVPSLKKNRQIIIFDNKYPGHLLQGSRVPDTNARAVAFSLGVLLRRHYESGFLTHHTNNNNER